MMKERIRISLICENGCSGFAMHEMSTRFKVSDLKEISDTALEFSSTPTETVRIMYSSQAAKRVLWHIDAGTFKDLDGLTESVKQAIEGFPIGQVISTERFKIECDRIGEHDFNSVEVEQELGLVVKQLTETEIDLKHPEITIYINIIDDKYIIGVDLAGRDLSKRQYKVFNHANAIKGTIGFSLLMFAGYETRMSMLDPYSLSGTIAIEAALMLSSRAVNFYERRFAMQDMRAFSGLGINEVIQKIDDEAPKFYGDGKVLCVDAQFRNIVASKKNAKIAGVEKAISFSRNDVDWLDIKIPEKSIDLIASRPIEPSKSISENLARKSYSELFNRAKQYLADDAGLAFIVSNFGIIVEEAEKHGFALAKKAQVFQGRQPLFFILLCRKK